MIASQIDYIWHTWKVPKNSLLHRKQKVVFNGSYSKPSAVVSEVLQGPILSPLLFAMFIIDLLLVADSHVHMFAGSSM